MLKLRVPHCLLRETTYVQELAYRAIDGLRQDLQMLAVIDGNSLYSIWTFLGASDWKQLRRAILERVELWQATVPKKEKNIFRIRSDYTRLANEIRVLTKRRWTLREDVENTAKELSAALNTQLGLKIPNYTIKLGIFPRDLFVGDIGIADPEKKEIRLRIELTNGILSLWRRKYTIAHELVHTACARYSRTQAPWFVEGMAVFYGLRALSSVDPMVRKVYEDLLTEMPFEYQEGYRRLQFLERTCGRDFIRRLACLRSSTIHDRVYATLLYFSEILPEDVIRIIVKWCESKPRAHDRIAMMTALNLVQIRVLAFLVSKYMAMLVRRRLRFYVNNTARILAMKKGEVRAAIRWLVKLKLIEWKD